MKTILVPVGTSTNAQSHLKYAIDFARAIRAKVFVVQIYNVYSKAGSMIKVDQILEAESKAFLEKHVASINTEGVEVHTRTYKGKLVKTLEKVCQDLEVDLVVLEPRTNSIKDEVYLGKTSGKIIKRTHIPALIVPEGCEFKPYSNILMAVKSALIKKDRVLQPLKTIKGHFKSAVTLLLVKTPYHKESDFEINKELESIISTTQLTESPTTFMAVLEHHKENEADLLCVVRRKRGFFNKLWEKDTILKKDFYTKTMPVLVLSELK